MIAILDLPESIATELEDMPVLTPLKLMSCKGHSQYRSKLELVYVIDPVKRVLSTPPTLILKGKKRA